jgi:methionyl-tRNA synthetase
MNKVNEIDEYLTGQQPWAMDKVKNQEKIQEVLTDAVFAVLQIAEQIKPFLPQTSQSILEKVNLSRKKIEQGEPLFPRR